MLANQRLGVGQSLLKRRDLFRAADITERDRCIAKVATTLGAADRTVAEFPVEPVRVQLQLPDELRGMGAVTGREGWIAFRGCEPVPRADLLADIAAKDPVA